MLVNTETEQPVILKLYKRASVKKFRKKLWNIDPRCCYCKQVTEFIENDKKVKTKPKNLMATVEHIHTKFDEKERYENKEFYLCALACFKCNNIMGSIRQAMVPIEELRERSQRHTSKINDDSGFIINATSYHNNPNLHLARVWARHYVKARNTFEKKRCAEKMFSFIKQTNLIDANLTAQAEFEFNSLPHDNIRPKSDEANSLRLCDNYFFLIDKIVEVIKNA